MSDPITIITEGLSANVWYLLDLLFSKEFSLHGTLNLFDNLQSVFLFSKDGHNFYRKDSSLQFWILLDLTEN
jgi:hypothetical protein